MSKVCNLCGKGADFGNTRSHSMVATRTRREPNLQYARFAVIGGNSLRARVCTSCLRTMKKPQRMAEKALRAAKAAEATGHTAA